MTKKSVEGQNILELPFAGKARLYLRYGVFPLFIELNLLDIPAPLGNGAIEMYYYYYYYYNGGRDCREAFCRLRESCELHLNRA